MIPEQKKKGVPVWAIVLISLAGCLFILATPVGLLFCFEIAEGISHPHSGDSNYWITTSKKVLNGDRDAMEKTCTIIDKTGIHSIWICKPNEKEDMDDIYLRSDKNKYRIVIYHNKSINDSDADTLVKISGLPDQ